ncbi:big1 [Carex rostrata]
MAKCNDSNQLKTPVTPPLPPQRNRATNKPGLKKPVEVTSVTREEIDIFWRRKKMVEEEHLMAAQKAAARLRAKDFKEEDYRRFEQLLREIIDSEDGSEKTKARNGGAKEEKEKVGIKDWWTKSKYAYLNQPAVKSMIGSYTYVPQKICFSYCPPAPYQMCTATSFGVF